MRGSPLLRALIAFLVIASLGYPLSRLTGDSKAPGELPKIAAPTGSTDIYLQLNFTAPATSLRVLHLGKEVWSEPAPQLATERKVQLPYPKEGVDLRFQVVYPEGASLAAVRVRLTDPDGREHEKSLWGAGRIDDVLTFK